MITMKLVGYDTSKAHTTEIVKSMLASCRGELRSIASFERDGLPDCDLIVISGILRGTGLVYKACVEQNEILCSSIMLTSSKDTTIQIGCVW